MTNNKTSPRALFKSFAFAEAVTWTLLLGGLAYRALFGMEQLVLTVIGGLHGLVFLGYAVTASLVGVNQRWGLMRTVSAVALAIVPFATVPFELSVDRKGGLAGVWRTEASAHKGDTGWFDSLFRWFIKRPALLIITMLVIVSAIFAALIVIGPPGGWPKD